MPVFRNPQYYFREGFCWTFILNENSEYQKARIKYPTVNDVNAMALYPVENINISIKYLVCLFNSFFIYSYKHLFVNNTSSFQINDARQIPIIIPKKNQLEEFEFLFDSAYMIKRSEYSNKVSVDEAEIQLNKLQERIDNLVKLLYKLI
jgi:hypothetical protein